MMLVGDEVIWTPQGHTIYSDNIGKIVETVDAFEFPPDKHELIEKYHCKIMYEQPTHPRTGRSYLVLCDPVSKHHKAKMRLYWPRTSLLRKVVDNGVLS